MMESELLHPPNLDQGSTGTLTYLRVKKNADRTRDPYIRNSCAHVPLPPQELNLYVLIPLASATVFRDCPVPKHVS